jgi:predicted nucleic acid-binding protein
MVCVDTSLLVGLFIEEEYSQEAWEWLAGREEKALLSPLNELEFVNALALRVFRQQLTNSEAFDVEEKFSRMKKGRFFQVGKAPREVWTMASRLAREHSAGIGTRSLDVWQVAFALVHEAGVFGTFDQRQRELAELVGLEINPMD